MRISLIIACAAALLAAGPAQADRDESMDYVRAGAAALAKGNPRAARIELLNAIKADPENGIARLAQAIVYLKLDDGIAAEAELLRARQTGVAPNRTYHLMAHALLLQGAIDRALQEADAARIPAVHAAYAARIRGQALLADDPDAAKREFDLALQLGGSDPDVLIDVGRFRLSRNDLGGAMQAAERAIAIGPRNVEAIVFRGELGRKLDGPAAAMAWFDRALAIDTNNAPALIEKAATLGDLRQMRGMLALTRKVLSLQPGNPNAFYLQSVLAARAHNFALARTLLQRTKGALDERPAAMMLGGVIEYQTGNYEQAIERLERLVAIEPDNAKARRVLGAAQWRAGDMHAAVDALQPLADLPRADDETLKVIGRAYAALGQQTLAANYLARAALPMRRALMAWPAPDSQRLAALAAGVDAMPKSPGPRLALIRALLRLGRNREALAQALVLRQVAPQSVHAHVMLGDVMAALDHPAEALQSYRQAATIDFIEPVAFRLVEAERRTGDTKAAFATLDRFLGEHPDNLSAELLAADFLMTVQQWPRAITLLEKARGRIGEHDSAMLNSLAWAYFQTGDTESAVSFADKAYMLAPNSPSVSNTYGWILYRSGRQKVRGLSLIEQAAAQAPKAPGPRWNLALAYAAEGRLPEARAAAQAALTMPGFAEKDEAQKLLARL